jgi:hypothetical protein
VESLVLISVQESSKIFNVSNKIFGGYSSIGFSSIGDNFMIYDNYRFYYSSDNFIFSFENGEDIQNMKISQVINNSKAILDHDDNGFNFGQGSLSMNNRILYVHNDIDNYGNNMNTDIWFSIETIDKIEVYIVIKK